MTLLCTVLLPGIGVGCVPHCDPPVEFLSLRVVLVDSESEQPLIEVGANAAIFTSVGPDASFGPGEQSLITDEDGNVEFTFVRVASVPCLGYVPSQPHTSIPVPDEAEVIVVRDECEQRFRVPVNSDAALIEVTERGDPIVTLLNPIRVPPCEDGGRSASEETDASGR